MVDVERRMWLFSWVENKDVDDTKTLIKRSDVVIRKCVGYKRMCHKWENFYWIKSWTNHTIVVSMFQCFNVSLSNYFTLATLSFWACGWIWWCPGGSTQCRTMDLSDTANIRTQQLMIYTNVVLFQSNHSIFINFPTICNCGTDAPPYIFISRLGSQRDRIVWSKN